MKLTKTSWIALVAGIILIAGLSLGWTYSQQNSQQKQLDTDLAEANQRLAKISLDDLNLQKVQLTEEMEQIGTRTEDVKAKMISSKDSIDATDAILEGALKHNVEVVDMSSSGIASESLSGIDSETLSIEIKVEGNVDDIADFAISLSQIFPTGVVKTVQMQRLTPSTSTPTPISTPTPTPTVIPTPTPDPTAEPTPAGFTPIVPTEKDFSASISLVIYNYKGE